jgi:hypothetical protein
MTIIELLKILKDYKMILNNKDKFQILSLKKTLT